MPYSGLIRVLVADDHAVVRGGIVGILNAQTDMKVVSDVADGSAAVEQYHAHQPDVALIDLQMPGLDGVRVVEEIRSKDAEARPIILTTYDTDDDIERSLRPAPKHIF